MKRVASFLLLFVLLLGIPVSVYAENQAIATAGTLSGVGSVTSGDTTYPVIDGLMIKRPSSDVMGYFHYGSMSWYLWVLKPGDLEIGLVFDKDQCPATRPAFYAMLGEWEALGTEAVAYGSQLVWEYAITAEESFIYVEADVTLNNGEEVTIAVNFPYRQTLVDLSATLSRDIKSIHYRSASEDASTTLGVYDGIGWKGVKPFTVEDCGSDRFVLRMDDYTPGDINFMIFFVPDQLGKNYFFAVQDYSGGFMGMGTRLLETGMAGYSTDTSFAGHTDPICYGSSVLIQWDRNTMLSFMLMGEGGSLRYVSFIINPSGDFSFPVLGGSGRKDGTDTKHQAAFDKLMTAIRSAEGGSRVAIDATDLDHLPFYLADELHAVSGLDITLEVTYKDEGGEKKVFAINSADVRPAATNRIYYPLTQSGLAALSTG